MPRYTHTHAPHGIHMFYENQNKIHQRTQWTIAKCTIISTRRRLAMAVVVVVVVCSRWRRRGRWTLDAAEWELCTISICVLCTWYFSDLSNVHKRTNTHTGILGAYSSLPSLPVSVIAFTVRCTLRTHPDYTTFMIIIMKIKYCGCHI